MNVFNKILCPVDFSDYSKLALKYAVAIAMENHAMLCVSHSIPDLTQTISYLERNYISTVDEALTMNAAEKLDHFMKQFSTDEIQITKIVDRGNPAEVILKAAKYIEADLIVMGTHGHSGYERFFVGSVTNRVLYKASVPVLVVCRPSHHFVDPGNSNKVAIKKILCALDFEANNGKISKLALDLASMHASQIVFLHAVPKGMMNEVQPEKFQEFIDPKVTGERNVQLIVQSGDPAEVILEQVRKTEVDLVVLGHHSRRPIEEIFLGSVAKRVVTDSICPVLVARSVLDIPVVEPLPELLEAYQPPREAITGA